MAVSFHILIATKGRPSLQNMLDSLKSQLKDIDAVTIVFDGPNAKEGSGFSHEWLNGFICPVAVHEQIPALESWGHGIRNAYQERLTPQATFVLHADDDDTYMPSAFESLRKLCEKKNTLYIARMERRGELIPRQSSICDGNIGTPCGIIPFECAGKAQWENSYGGDGKYYINLKEHVSDVQFLDEVIYRVG